MQLLAEGEGSAKLGQHSFGPSFLTYEAWR